MQPSNKITIINGFYLSNINIDFSFRPKIDLNSNILVIKNTPIIFSPINIDRRIELSHLLQQIMSVYMASIDTGKAIGIISDIKIIKPYTQTIKNIFKNIRKYYESGKNNQLVKNIASYLTSN